MLSAALYHDEAIRDLGGSSSREVVFSSERLAMALKVMSYCYQCSTVHLQLSTAALRKDSHSLTLNHQ
jgi:hypothetical protein